MGDNPPPMHLPASRTSRSDGMIHVSFREHRQCIDVADAAAIHVARVGMMKSVGAPPEIVGRQGQYADSPSDPVIRQTMTKKQPVAAIFLRQRMKRLALNCSSGL
jgi:hypothetical protein